MGIPSVCTGSKSATRVDKIILERVPGNFRVPVLYTHQKTKKSKKWQDGKLKITQNGRIELFDDSNNKVETVYVKAGQIQVGEEVESDRHLITIEEASSSSSGANRSKQENIRQITEEKNERIQPVCRQPLRKRRTGFTIPRLMNQPTVTAVNDVEINAQCNQSSEEGHLNSDSRQGVSQSLETRASLLSSPLFSSKPLQRHSYKVFHQDGNANEQKGTNIGCNPRQRNTGHDPLQKNTGSDPLQRNTGHDLLQGNNCYDQLQRNASPDQLQRNKNYNSLNRNTGHEPLQRNTGHDPLNKPDIFASQIQFEGKIFKRTQDTSSEDRTQGFEDEVMESENGREACTGGKRSASQILALLGKKKNNFQPPLKRTRLDSELVGINSDSGVRLEYITKPDNYHAESDMLGAENEVYQGGISGQEDANSWTEEGGRHNLQQQGHKILTGMFENCNVHASSSVLSKSTMLSFPKSIVTKTGVHKDCSKEEDGIISHEICHQENNEKDFQFEEPHTAVAEKEDFEGEGVCGKTWNEGCMETVNDCRQQAGCVFKELSSPTKFSASCGKACIHRTKEGDVCGGIEVTVKAKKWTGKHGGKNIPKGDGGSHLSGNSEGRQDYGSISNDCYRHSSSGKVAEICANVEAEDSVVSMADEMPQELISFDLFMEDADETKVRSEEGHGVNETVNECYTNGRNQSVGRKDERDDEVVLSNRQSIPFCVMEGDAYETGVRNDEGSSMSETVDECNTKGWGQSLGRKDIMDDVISLKNEQSVSLVMMDGDAKETGVRNEEGSDTKETVTGCNAKGGDQSVVRIDGQDGEITVRSRQSIHFGAMEGNPTETRVRNEDKSGMNETVDGCSTKGQLMGRKDARDNMVALRNRQSVPFDGKEQDSDDTRIRSEENGVNETVDEIYIKGKGQSVERKDGSKKECDEVIAPGSGQLKSWYQEDIKDGCVGDDGKRLDIVYADVNAVEETPGKISNITDATSNFQSDNVTKDIANLVSGASTTKRANADSGGQIRATFNTAESYANGNNVMCLDTRGDEVSISDVGQEDGFNDGNDAGWCIDAVASSMETDCLISTTREVDLVANKICISPNLELTSSKNVLRDNNDNVSPLESTLGQVSESLPSIFVTQSTSDSGEGADSPVCVSTQEEQTEPGVHERGEVYSQSKEVNTTISSAKGTAQHGRGTGQLKFDIKCKNRCSLNDTLQVAVSSENVGRYEDITIDNQTGHVGNVTKQSKILLSVTRSKLSVDWEESPSDGININSQNSLLSVTTTDTLDSSFTGSQESFSGLKAVKEGMDSMISAGGISEFGLREVTPCKSGKDVELLNHEDRDSVTDTSRYAHLKKSERVAEVEKSSEHDVFEMLQACLDQRDSSEMIGNTTLGHPQVLKHRNEIAHHDGITQKREASSCIPHKSVTTEAWLPTSPKPPLSSNLLGRSVANCEDIKFDDPQPSQLAPRCSGNCSSDTFSQKKGVGAAINSHQLKKELGSSAQKKVTGSLSESDSNIHLHKNSQTHYWYQPLASNVVRRRPPSPTVTFASTCRTDFPSLDLKLWCDRSEELRLLKQNEDGRMMLQPDLLNPEKDFLSFEIGDQRGGVSRGMKNELDTSVVLGDNKIQRRGERQWMPEPHDGNVEDNLLGLSEVHANVGNQLKQNMHLTNRNTMFCLTQNEENKDDPEATLSVQPQNTLPAFIGPSCGSDGSDLATLQSHKDLLQELDKDSFAVPPNDDTMARREIDFFHPESPVLPLFADIRRTLRNDKQSNSSPFHKVPSSSQEYLSPPAAPTKFFFQDENSDKEKEICTPCDGIAADFSSCSTVFREMFGSESLNPHQPPTSKSFLSCQQDHWRNEHSRVVPQWSREHLSQLGTAHQMKLQDPQNESVTEFEGDCTSWSCNLEEPIKSDDGNALDNGRGSVEQETDVPVLDLTLSQEAVDEIDSQMDLFMSQPDEDRTLEEDGQEEDAVRRDENNQDESVDDEHKVLSESLNASSFIQKAKVRKRPLVAIATEDYQSSQLFVKSDDITVPGADKVYEHSQSMNYLTGGEESCHIAENNCNTKPTVIQTSDCSIDVSVNKWESHPSHWNKPLTQKQSGHMTGRRRPLHQMQTSFQSPSPCLAVSSQTGKFQTPSMTKQHQSSGLEGVSCCLFFTHVFKDPDRKNLSGDLMFPSLEDTSSTVIPQRQVSIPTFFQDAASYKQVLTAVLREHLNIILFQVSHNFFTALSKVDVSAYSSTKSVTKGIDTQNPACQHKQPSKKVCVKKEGPNKGRFFFTCSNARGSQCKFFQWADHKTQRSSKGQQNRPEREVLSDAKSIEMYMKSFGVSLYCECQLLRKSPFPDNIPGAPAWIKKYRQQKLNNERKKLYLRLSRKEGSSVYGKDDLWVISKDLRFDPGQSFLVKSVFHGPNSSSELEIEPLGGYSPSNWPNECTVHAIHAYNASTELTCLSNIKEFVNPRILPILPALLKRDHSSQPVIQSQASFKSPAIALSLGRKLHCSDDQIRHLADLVVTKYSLNEDQAQALQGVAEMLTTGDTEVPPVKLIHGVFGAGKSYLLAVTVLFLTQIFQLHQEGGGDPNDWKVLISSTTNVAVDRILLSLLDLGFEEFIRVGSIRKIAKPVLPYSVHASDKSNQELKELQEMLRGDLSTAEKNLVRKSIERQRLGLNKKMLSKVLVVGVTCAACTFPCIHNLKFPVVLLDECSQITEPACLLPVARFECQKLVLVGDPKQLDPTIQGSEPNHDTSLEQTLFDRLLLMGYEPTLLRTQYRCHPHISAIANDLFYENKLLDGVREEQRMELAEGFPTLCFFNVANGKECCTTGGSYLNDKEGAFVVTMIEMLVGSGVEASQIGVITLYKAQVAHVTVLLQQSRLGSSKEIKAIQISTVDAFQGGEKDIIILSCVRTDFMGFAASDKRINVALTRSRNHLLIVGNQKILSANSLWKRVIAKCRECKKGIQDSVAVLKEWVPKLAELRLAAEKEKKQPKSKKSKKISDTQNTVLSIQSECVSSPPLSLGSTVDEEDQSVPEVISVSTPSNSFQEQPSDLKSCISVCNTESTQQIHFQGEQCCADELASLSAHNPEKHCLQEMESDLSDYMAMRGSTSDT
ncbi:Protein ZGRF1 [Holothuria leucospilota]|uniref:Protein ZGRF1 n=1 Tax=Holothuria leucospilota TaxID=206669 RepID=A0A9Q0YIH1_HOLLE|nr:Protein ZGRF1 [Holothuria leucospilota]